MKAELNFFIKPLLSESVIRKILDLTLSESVMSRFKALFKKPYLTGLYPTTKSLLYQGLFFDLFFQKALFLKHATIKN
jgi:hypothetical protein